MSNQVILVNKKKYAVGLFWQPLPMGANSRRFAHSLARSMPSVPGMFAEYRGMDGLSAKRAGQRVGMFVAAPEVMESLAEYSMFLAVFQTNAGWWIIAVRNGIIIKDSLFENENDARTEFMALSSMPDWGVMIAPNSWGVARTISRALDEIMSGSVRVMLKPISRFWTNIVSVLFACLFLVGLFYFFRAPINEIINPVNVAPVAAPQIIVQQPIVVEPEPITVESVPLEMPFDYLPNANVRAQLCYQAIGFVMQPITGWNQTSAICGEVDVITTLRRTNGSLNEFYNIAGDLMPGAFVNEISENEIQITAKLPQMIASASQDERDGATIVRDINTMFQKMGMPVQTNVLVDVIGNETQNVNLNVVEIGAESKLTPPEFIKMFENFGGVYMTRAEWNGATKTWNYEVIIYAK